MDTVEMARNSPTTVAPRAPAGRFDAAQALRPGQYVWEHSGTPPIRIHLLFVPCQVVEVRIAVHRAQGHDIRLSFGLCHDTVEFGELVGNGFDRPALHRKGYGTLAVNVALQAIQSICPPCTRIKGVLSNVDEAHLPLDQRHTLAENRRAFWRRFGVSVITNWEGADHLDGAVGDLRIVPGGTVGSLDGRVVPLSEFRFSKPDSPPRKNRAYLSDSSTRHW